MTDYEHDVIIYIGRFQPAHLAHFKIKRRALELAKTLIVVVGSCGQAPTFKNPWSGDEREEMIYEGLDEDVRHRVHVLHARDLPKDNAWVQQVQDLVATVTSPGDDIRIIGHSKDESSYYLEMFPQWGPLIEVGDIKDIHASDVREALWTATDAADFDLQIGRDLPPKLHGYLQAFMLTDKYEQLKREYEFTMKYRKQWRVGPSPQQIYDEMMVQGATADAILQRILDESGVPHPVQFNTVDSVIIQSGHVLLIKRRSEPGKGLWALPGGFLDETERMRTAFVRELREETGLKIPQGVVIGKLQDMNNWYIGDAPERSLRGRTITHAVFFDLAPGPLPKVKGMDDAAKAKWIPLSAFERMESQMFEDHYQIVKYFTG